MPTIPFDFSVAHVEELEDIAPTRRVDGQDLFWWGAARPLPSTGCEAHLALALPRRR